MRSNGRGRATESGSRRTISAIVAATALAAASALSAPTPAPADGGAGGSAGPAGLRAADRVRLAEAFRLAEVCGDEVWPGWDAAPFELLLVTEERELLFRPSERPAGLEEIGRDPGLGGPILSRERQFPPNLLATFPAFGPTPTIVVGTAEATGAGSTQWVVKVLHEHFHQLQMSAPGYYEESDALGLADGDDQGQWMLDYPFPYDSSEVGERYAALSSEVARRLERAPGEAAADLEDLWSLLGRLRESVSEKDYNYLSFQLWQEGVSRYVELEVAECAASRFEPSTPFRELADFESFSSFATRLRESVLEGLRAPSLAEERRVAFYDLGAGIALLLDRAGADWKRRYLQRKFFLDAYGER